MANIDEDIVAEVVDRFSGEVQHSMLTDAIYQVNTSYAKLKKADIYPIDFETLIEDAIDHCDLRTLFEFEAYKHAIGTYYAKRRAKERKEREAQEAVVGKVVGKPSAQAATIRASYEVVICFKALKPSGKLDFLDIDTGVERTILHGQSRTVREDLYLAAKRKALAIMNSRRT